MPNLSAIAGTRIETATLTIGSGQTVSDALFATSSGSYGAIIPATFTGTALSFQVSSDNATFQALYDRNGTLVSVPVAQGRTYDLPGELSAWPYWQAVSNASEGGARAVVIVARD